MFISFVVLLFTASVGLWPVGTKLNNSNNFYFVQRTLIHELSFDLESVKDITSSLRDIFPQKFNYTSIELQGVLPSKNSFPVHETQIYEFLGFKKSKKITLVDFFRISFVISQSRQNKIKKKRKKSFTS